MASPFKIPKKKQPAGSDSAPPQMSPLSRLQSSTPEFKSYGDQSSRGRGERVHAGNSVGSSAIRQSEPLFRNVVKTLLGLNSPHIGASAANHRGASAANHRGASAASHRGASAASHRGASAASHSGRWSCQTELSSSCFSNGWRPKRASDRLLPPEESSERPSPPQKKRSDLSGSATESVSVDSLDALDSLAELRGDGHAGSLSSLTLGERTWRRDGDAAEDQSDSGSSPEPLKQQKKKSGDHFLSPSRTENQPSVTSVRTPPDTRRSLDRTAWLSAGSSNVMADLREKERERWRKFREKKKTTGTTGMTVLQRKRAKQTEPIVLSSEEEEGDGGQRTESQEKPASRREADEFESPPPSFLQLDFTSLHAGLTHADANGKMMITEHGLNFPLNGVGGGEVVVVASQLRGYGVWDGAVAQGGSLLADWRGPAPSLLFLWVTDAQANLLQRELTAMGPPCCFLLLVLQEQLQELQAALLASILDMEEYRRGCSSYAPLEWTDGLLLLHSAPPPLDQHLLGLLGHSAVKTNQRNKKTNLDSPGLQQLPPRLIQYPAPPCKGRIAVTKEDLACLRGGEFLNDVIIDFYLKYVLLEGGGSVSDRSHVFSSFFYKQLSRRRAAGDEDAPAVPDRHMRHQRVKTWTRHIDIFTKDFLFVPVNQEAHWYLVVVCFPGLEEVQYEEFHSPAAAGNTSSFSPRSQQPPECTQQSWPRDTVLKRPCILVMDSLKLSYHENVCRLLRDYLQVEWAVRRGTTRLFTADSVRSCSCRVPQQDNSSDCGLYLLQYAESFLQNPVVHFDLPLRLDNWFPRQRVRQKREEIRTLILKMHRSQNGEN